MACNQASILADFEVIPSQHAVGMEAMPTDDGVWMFFWDEQPSAPNARDGCPMRLPVVKLVVPTPRFFIVRRKLLGVANTGLQ